MNNDNWDDTTGLYNFDTTSFFIGLPTVTDNTYQQGQTTNIPIIILKNLFDLPNKHYDGNITRYCHIYSCTTRSNATCSR